MTTPIRPVTVAAPAGGYELAMHTAAGSDMLFTAGIVGFRPDGTLPPTLGEQLAEVWHTIDQLLAEGGFARTDVVSYTTYVKTGGDLALVGQARDRFFAGHRAASAMVTVPQLVSPDWLVEVSVIAARP